MSEPFVNRIRVRYHECDRQGIVFNAHWFAYFDTTLTELCRAAFGSYDTMIEEGSDVVVAEARARFLAPARFDEEIDVAFEIERLGTSSMTVAASVTRAGDRLVEGRLVYVFVDPVTLAKQAIPASMRERLAPWTAA